MGYPLQVSSFVISLLLTNEDTYAYMYISHPEVSESHSQPDIYSTMPMQYDSPINNVDFN